MREDSESGNGSSDRATAKESMIELAQRHDRAKGLKLMKREMGQDHIMERMKEEAVGDGVIHRGAEIVDQGMN